MAIIEYSMYIRTYFETNFQTKEYFTLKNILINGREIAIHPQSLKFQPCLLLFSLFHKSQIKSILANDLSLLPHPYSLFINQSIDVVSVSFGFIGDNNEPEYLMYIPTFFSY
jgi:hypothetical protein